MRNILFELGCFPIEEDHFPETFGDFKKLLTDMLFASQGFIQIIGECYGNEPLNQDKTLPRRSNTQIEYDYACERFENEPRIFLFMCAHQFPYQQHNPESDDLVKLQQAYRKQIKDKVFTVRTPKQLYDLIYRLKEFVSLTNKALLEQHKDFLKRLACNHVSAPEFLATIRYRSAMSKILGEKMQHHKTKYKIKKYSDAQKVRETYAHMLGITLDQLNKKLNSERKDILDIFRAVENLRKSFPRTKNGLLFWREINRKMGDLCRLEGYEQVQNGCNFYLTALHSTSRKANPHSWAELQSLLGYMLSTWADISIGEVSGKMLDQAISAYRKALKVYHTISDRLNWAMTQNNLSTVLHTKSEVSSGKISIRALRDSIEAVQSALTVYDRKKDPENWAIVNLNLSLALYSQSTRTSGELSDSLLQASINASDSALKVYKRETHPDDWARTKRNQVLSLNALAERASSTSEASKIVRKIAVIYRNISKIYTLERNPFGWASLKSNMAVLYKQQAKYVSAQRGYELLNLSIEASHAALKVYSKRKFPQDWATVNENLVEALSKKAKFLESREARILIQKAIDILCANLSIRIRKEFPYDWAKTQFNLAMARRELAMISQKRKARRLIEDAISRYDSILKIFTKTDYPHKWEETKINLSASLYTYSQYVEGKESKIALLKRAIRSSKEALSICRKEQFADDWAIIQNNLGGFYYNLAVLSDHKIKSHRLSLKSLKHYKLSLEIRIREKVPQDWADTMLNYCNALLLCGESSQRYRARYYYQKTISISQTVLIDCDKQNSIKFYQRFQDIIDRAKQHISEQ